MLFNYAKMLLLGIKEILMSKHQEREIQAFKKLMSFPRILQHFIEGFVPDLVDKELDFSSLQLINDQEILDNLPCNKTDFVWKVQSKGGLLYLFLDLEKPYRIALSVLDTSSLRRGF